MRRGRRCRLDATSWWLKATRQAATCAGLWDFWLCSTRSSTRNDVPMLAAGGIGSGRAMAAAPAAGAAGVRVGTRFVATTESGSHPDYIQTLIGASAADTVITTAFSGHAAPRPSPGSTLSAGSSGGDLQG